jgi:hypothetical protein
LTISQGQAQVKWGDRMLEGSVTPQGGLTMRTGYGHRFDGRIDNQNTVTGRMTAGCAYILTWRKAP